MKWDCEKQGCFNEKKRPKIEEFHDCFPGQINFSDVDGIVEIDGRFLLLEWKPHSGQILRGQELMYERITGRGDGDFVVFVVAGDAESMRVSDLSMFVRGRQQPWQCCDLDGLKAQIRRWVEFTKGQKAT
jgi:hypothetical protein